MTGSLAMELQLVAPRSRRLNDIDIVVSSFDSLPSSLAGAFLFRHIHPGAIEGKTLMQLIDAELAIRIDVFRECGATLQRSKAALVSLQDLAARAARVVLDLEAGLPVPRKHADDFLRLEPTVNSDLAEIAWRDHRKNRSPATFREAARRIHELIQSRHQLLITPEYSQDVNAVCEQCDDTVSFRRAPAATIRAILGYC
ncbi:MAG: hypothetical protein LAP38_06960 [Acidobacteriia bacterium]|nr:hypothetical protein [Terriglobia bacterium]